MLSKIKAAIAKIKAAIAHSTVEAEVKDALERVHAQAVVAVHDALAKLPVLEADAKAAAEAAIETAIKAVEADILGGI
jgi:hypothetical protein